MLRKEDFIKKIKLFCASLDIGEANVKELNIFGEGEYVDKVGLYNFKVDLSNVNEGKMDINVIDNIAVLIPENVSNFKCIATQLNPMTKRHIKSNMVY